jgi:transposase-like protein
MKRRRWDSKTKTKIVLEGLSGKPVSEICNDHGIHQNQYYSWRDKFLSEAHRAF